MLIAPLAHRQLDHRAYYLRSTPDGRVIVAASREGAVTVLGPGLGPLHEFELQMRLDGLTLTPDGTRLVLFASGRFLVTGIDGAPLLHAEHANSGDFHDCLFSSDGKTAWAACDVEPAHIELQRRETMGWRVERSTMMEDPAPPSHIDLVLHPEGRAFAIWAAAGQDGQWIYWAYDNGRTIRFAQLPFSLYITAPKFHPVGGEFLVVEDDYTLRRYTFPDCRLLGELEWPENEEEEDDVISGYLCYLSDDRALVHSDNGRLWVVDLNSMKIAEEVVLGGQSPRRKGSLEGSLSFFEQVGPKMILTVHYSEEDPVSGKNALALWGGPPLFGELSAPDPACSYTARLLEIQGWT
jgi:hypothetical protein